jgi:hypothetical protein
MHGHSVNLSECDCRHKCWLLLLRVATLLSLLLLLLLLLLTDQYNNCQ